MAGIEIAVAIAEEPNEALESAFVEFYDVAISEAHGVRYSEIESVNPLHYAIPEDQWVTICSLIIQSGDGLTGALMGMKWMTHGPSAYSE